MFDRARFSLASGYVDRRPQGTDSYPACQGRALVFEQIGKDFPRLATGSEPGILRQLLRGELDSSRWIPEVVGQIATLMMLEECFESDREYLDWMYRTNSAA